VEQKLDNLKIQTANTRRRRYTNK